MRGNSTFYVIAIQNRQPIGSPVSYNQFLNIHLDCPEQEVPTNQIIGPYGFEVFEYSSMPSFGIFEHEPVRTTVYVCRDDGMWTDTWQITPFTEQEITAKTEKQWIQVRTKRNGLLRMTDWTQLPDTTINQTDLTTWRTYRQTLRDLPSTITDPFVDINWPIPPVPFTIPSSSNSSTLL